MVVFTNKPVNPLLSSLVLMFLICSSGCQSSKVVFKSRAGKKPKDIILMPIGDSTASGESLGSTPIEIPFEKLENKMIRIELSDEQYQYWFFPDLAGNENVITLTPSGSKEGNTVLNADFSAETRNQINRLLLKSYQALSSNQLDDAIGLAKQASKIDPKISAPQILLGLALIEQNKLSEARLALKNAQALDPLDKEIEQLLENLK